MIRIFRDIIFVISGRNDLGERMRLPGKIARDAREAARFSRGSVAMQDGSFVTSDELKRERAMMARHQFN